MDLIDALDRTFAHAHDVVAGARPDQHDDETPCAEWTLRDLPARISPLTNRSVYCRS
jgi:hypothetical protein